MRIGFILADNIDTDRPCKDETGDQGFSSSGFLALWMIYHI